MFYVSTSLTLEFFCLIPSHTLFNKYLSSIDYVNGMGTMISVLSSLDSKVKIDNRQAHNKNDRRHGHEESWGGAEGVEHAKALG